MKNLIRTLTVLAVLAFASVALAVPQPGTPPGPPVGIPPIGPIVITF